jgi:hypothetical protein
MRPFIGPLALSLAVAAPAAQAAFLAFEGGIAAQGAWRAAAGSFVIETFESFAINSTVSALPSLGLNFAPLVGGGSPGIYAHAVDDTPFGAKQLANFPGNCCITAPYQFGDLVANVAAGVTLLGLGFWNGDPQGSSVLRVYDRSNGLIGTVTALINANTPGGQSSSFAGFLSDVAIGRLEWEGNAGDGWNHYDGLQATFAGPGTVATPEPVTLGLFGAGLLGLAAARRRGRAGG